MKKVLSVLLVTVAMGVLLIGCNSENEEISTSNEENSIQADENTELENNGDQSLEEEDSEVAILDLADWNGTWNSITPYLDEEEVQGA